MTPGLGDITPTILSGAGKVPEIKPKQVERREPGDTKAFESVMSRQLKKRQADGKETGAPEEQREPESRDREEFSKRSDSDSFNANRGSSEAERKQQKVDAMVKFMVSLEGELGIEPEDMLQAMQAVQGEGQELTQEQAVAKALATLEVEPGGDVDRAAELYAEFLVASEYGAESLQKKGAVPVSDMNFQILTSEQLRKDEMTSNVKNLRSSFFGADGLAQPEIQGEQTGGVRKNPIQVPDLMNLEPEQAQGSEALDEELPEQPLYGKVASREKPDSLKSMTAMMQKPESQVSAAMLGMNLNQAQNSEVLNSEMGTMQAEMSSSPTSSLSSDSSTGDLDLTDMGAQEQGSDFDGNADSEAEFMIAPQQNGKTSTVKTTTALGIEKSEPTVDVENAQDIIDQAQVLVRKGGGTMRARLNPNGLGEVLLKVDVQNGNVNIQMVADHSEAKKALEKGINDLKENLALHKMNVENIKVDVSSEISKHLEQNDREQAQVREYARDFMGKMRDGGGSSREDFLESPDRQYFNQGREEINPISLGAQANSASTNDQNRRLNLVA